MSPEKDIVNWWLNRKGFFTINSIKVSQNKEIDILAIKFGEEIKIYHVEVSCSVSSGNIAFDREDIRESIQKFAVKKFEDKEIIKKLGRSIEEFVGQQRSCEKILVLGAFSKSMKEKAVRELKEMQINVFGFEDVLLEVLTNLDRQNYRHPTIRNLQLVKYLLLSNPEKLSSLLGRKSDVLNQFTREELIKALLHREEFIRALQKESNEHILVNILRSSSLKKPERLAKVLDEEILSKRTKKKFSEAIAKERAAQSNEQQKKDTPLSYFLEGK